MTAPEGGALTFVYDGGSVAAATSEFHASGGHLITADTSHRAGAPAMMPRLPEVSHLLG